jgi:hypothetical protein
MVKSFSALLISVSIISGCVPTSKFYLTPPTYFGTPHAVPVADSLKQLVISASAMIPIAAEVRCEYRANKNFVFNLSYFGNAGAYSKFSNNDIDYRYSTGSFDIQMGYMIQPHKKKDRFFIMAGFGKGQTTSIVSEYDNSTNFFYNNRFSRFTLTPGMYLIQKKYIRLSLSWRQSFTGFNKYELPDTAYHNKNQFLTDLMLNVHLPGKETGFKFFIGSFLNGMQGGNRQFDQKPELWRIERFYAGINFSYRFSVKKRSLMK